MKVKDFEECNGFVEERRERCQTTNLEAVKSKTLTASEEIRHNLRGILLRAKDDKQLKRNVGRGPMDQGHDCNEI